MWPNRENCKDFERSNRISNSISNRSQGIVFHRRLQAIQQHLPKGLDFIVVYVFRWPCYQIQADTPVDVWSNHACQVALFFPGVRTASSGGSVHLRSSRPQEMHPSTTKGHVNQQVASFQRPPKQVIPVVLLSLDWARNAPYSLEKVRVREGAVGPSFSQTATSRVPGYDGDLQNEKKQRQRQAIPSRGESPKGMKDLQPS